MIFLIKTVKAILISSIFAFGIFSIIASAPSTPTTSTYTNIKYHPVNRTYSSSYNNVWGAVISSISDLEWDTEYLDKDSGIIKFKTSYLVTDFMSGHSKRLYKDSTDQSAQYGNSKPWLREYTHYDESLKGNIKFTKQNLAINIVKLSASKTKVIIKFTLEGTAFWSGTFQPVSNGKFESNILDSIETVI